MHVVVRVLNCFCVSVTGFISYRGEDNDVLKKLITSNNTDPWYSIMYNM